jgi:hypothetical protein
MKKIIPFILIFILSSVLTPILFISISFLQILLGHGECNPCPCLESGGFPLIFYSESYAGDIGFLECARERSIDYVNLILDLFFFWLISSAFIYIAKIILNKVLKK